MAGARVPAQQEATAVGAVRVCQRSALPALGEAGVIGGANQMQLRVADAVGDAAAAATQGAIGNAIVIWTVACRLPGEESPRLIVEVGGEIGDVEEGAIGTQGRGPGRALLPL